MELQKCITKGCGNACRSRGVCGTCYASIRNIVRRGDATWEELEQVGAVSRPKKKIKSTILDDVKKLRESRRKREVAFAVEPQPDNSDNRTRPGGVLCNAANTDVGGTHRSDCVPAASEEESLGTSSRQKESTKHGR